MDEPVVVRMPRAAIRAPHPARTHQPMWLAEVNPPRAEPCAVTTEPRTATPEAVADLAPRRGDRPGYAGLRTWHAGDGRVPDRGVDQAESGPEHHIGGQQDRKARGRGDPGQHHSGRRHQPTRGDQRQPGLEHPAPPDPVRGGSGEHQEAGYRQGVAVDGPLQAADRGVQVAADGRERDIDGGHVHACDQQARAAHGRHEQSAPVGGV
ncbi:MAG: hypothetical protein JWR24_2051 [Actinoallomurus sp.]|nr:hypothetical protein [Actinoallomurus sp.]